VLIPPLFSAFFPALLPNEEIMETISFESAIERAGELLNEIESRSPASVQQMIAALVGTENGARGFFVVYLASALPLADEPTPETLEALRTSPEIVGELLVKNTAMSTAMAIFHRRNGDEKNAGGSERVRERTIAVIRRLRSPTVTEKLRRLLETLETGVGEYEEFLARWQYDGEQRRAIAEVARSLLSS
jgi:hypothetical protein